MVSWLFKLGIAIPIWDHKEVDPLWALKTMMASSVVSSLWLYSFFRKESCTSII